MCVSAVVEEADEQLLDAVMLRLRMSDGLDLDWVSAMFGQSPAEAISKCLQPHCRRGLVRFDHGTTAGLDRQAFKKLGRVRLTDPEGFLVSNDIISDVFLALNESAADRHETRG